MAVPLSPARPTVPVARPAGKAWAGPPCEAKAPRRSGGLPRFWRRTRPAPLLGEVAPFARYPEKVLHGLAPYADKLRVREGTVLATRGHGAREAIVVTAGHVLTAPTPTPQPDTSRPDAPRPDAPRPDAPRSDAPQPDAPRSDASRSDASRSDASRSDAPRSDAPRPDASRSDAPRLVDDPESGGAWSGGPRSSGTRLDVAWAGGPRLGGPGPGGARPVGRQPGGPQSDPPRRVFGPGAWLGPREMLAGEPWADTLVAGPGLEVVVLAGPAYRWAAANLPGLVDDTA